MTGHVEFKDITFDGENIEFIMVSYLDGKREDAELYSLTLEELEDGLVQCEVYFADAAYADIWA